MNALRKHWQALWTAVGYLIRIPVSASIGFSQAGSGHTARYFPLIGWLVGAVAMTVYWLALRTVPAQGVAVAVPMRAALLSAGAFHEDGLTDCADGFSGGYTPEGQLRTMHGSRIGVFGAIVVRMALLLKW